MRTCGNISPRATGRNTSTRRSSPQNLRPRHGGGALRRGMNCLHQGRRVFNCKYRYFYKYGLGLRSREQARFDPRNAGTFIHAMFERVMSDGHWMELTDDELARTVRRRADEYFDAILVDGEATAAFGFTKKIWRARSACTWCVCARS